MGKKSCGDDHHLPLEEDFFIQKILLRLPVKSLLRFKSVCKSWLKLIQTSFFIDLHTTTTFNSSSSSSNFGAFILQTIEYSPGYEYEGEIKMYMLSSGGDGDEDDDSHNKKMVNDLGFSPFYKDFLLTHTLRMVGSCNGIICLHDPELMDFSKGGEHRQHYLNLRDVSLWNPATKQFRILPKSIPIEEKQYYIGNWIEDFIAFGFDVETKDYKVLRITPWHQFEEGGCMCRAQVYSLSTDSWRLLEGINSLPVLPNQGMFLNSGIYLNGSYFFVGDKSESNTETCDFMLLSFDFTKEIFTPMQLPDDCSRHCEMVVSSLGEKLAVFTIPRIYCDGYDIWVLNEGHGGVVVVNNETWTKLHSHLFRIKKRGEPYNEPRCISNNGEFALISTGRTDDGGRNKLQLFNLVTKEAKKDFLIGTRECRADVYKESLVSIMGGGNVLLRGSSGYT